MVRRKSKKSNLRAPKVIFGRVTTDKRRINFKFIIYVLLGAALIYTIFFSPIFVISDVLVEGNRQASDSDIMSNVSYSQNIFLINEPDLVKKIISKNPEVKDAKIYKGIPNAIKIVVLEHEPSLLWRTEDKCYLVSSHGLVYEEVSCSNQEAMIQLIDQKNVPIFEGQRVTSSSFIAFVQNINANLSDHCDFQIDHFYVIETTFDVYLKTKQGIVFKFDSQRSSKKQLEDLKIVLSNAKKDAIKEYVDLRVDGWAYYR